MKRYFIFTLAFLLTVSLLCGCMQSEKKAETSSYKGETSLSDNSKKEESIAQSETESESQVASSEDSSLVNSQENEPCESEESKKEEINYLIKVKHVGSYIYSEPNFEKSPVSPMPVGTFTIVDEITDSEGNLWGKLKSGAGYINLSDINKEATEVSIGEADKEFLQNGNYISYGVKTEYSRPIVIQANENLSKVTFVTLEIFEGEAGAGDVLMHLEEMNENTFIVFHAEFPGDMTAYGLSLTDESGNFLRYEIYESGKDGTIIKTLK